MQTEKQRIKLEMKNKLNWVDIYILALGSGNVFYLNRNTQNFEIKNETGNVACLKYAIDLHVA